MITKEKFSLVVDDSILIPYVRQDNAFKEVDTKALIFKFYWINFILPISDMYCFNKLKKTYLLRRSSFRICEDCSLLLSMEATTNLRSNSLHTGENDAIKNEMELYD